MSKSVIDIQGLSCPDCANLITPAVEKVPGVRYAELNFVKGQLLVDGEYDLKTIESALENLGFRVKKPQNSTEQKGAKVLDFLGFWNYFIQSKDLPLMGAGLLLLILGIVLESHGVSHLLSLPLQLASLPMLGVLVFRGAWNGLIKERSINMGVLMALAAIGAVLIGEANEALIMLILFAVSESLEGYINDRARAVLSEFADLAPKTALLVTHNGEMSVPVGQLKKGDQIIVRPGERFAMDGKVLNGTSEVNQASITGESTLVPKNTGDEVFSGTVNGQGSLKVEVTKLAKDNTIQRIIALVTETQANRSKKEKFVDRFAAVYTPIVIALAVLVVLMPTFIFGQPLWNSAAGYGWLHRGLSLLMIGCPCALIISTPITLISGLTAAARYGVVFKGGVFLESLGETKVMAFDKTGTLTLGKPIVRQVKTAQCQSHSAAQTCAGCDELLALASSLEARSSHPLAQAVSKEAQSRGVAAKYPPAENARNLDGKGQEGWVNGKLATVGSLPLFEAQHADHFPESLRQGSLAAQSEGKTVMLLCDGQQVRGFIGVDDAPRAESAQVLRELKDLGIHSLILTGDNAQAAEKVRRSLGLDEVRSSLLPEDKLQAIQDLHERYSAVAMVGDGINDSPALAKADLGIAMGGAGNAQVLETSDVVLMNDNLLQLPFAVKLARFTNRLIKENIAISLSIKFVVAGLAVAGLTPLWTAVLADVGLALLVTLNGLRAARLSPQKI
ncbi:MAG: cation-translocating P-type ATPase [Anaerolineaceae bacterium]|nr:cation-translocating P-type ATPase [Anaerolineaceae bacterium]